MKRVSDLHETIVAFYETSVSGCGPARAPTLVVVTRVAAIYAEPPSVLIIARRYACCVAAFSGYLSCRLKADTQIATVDEGRCFWGPIWVT